MMGLGSYPTLSPHLSIQMSWIFPSSLNTCTSMPSTVKVSSAAMVPPALSPAVVAAEAAAAASSRGVSEERQCAKPTLWKELMALSRRVQLIWKRAWGEGGEGKRGGKEGEFVEGARDAVQEGAVDLETGLG